MQEALAGASPERSQRPTAVLVLAVGTVHARAAGPSTSGAGDSGGKKRGRDGDDDDDDPNKRRKTGSGGEPPKKTSGSQGTTQEGHNIPSNQSEAATPLHLSSQGENRVGPPCTRLDG